MKFKYDSDFNPIGQLAKLTIDLSISDIQNKRGKLIDYSINICIDTIYQMILDLKKEHIK